MTETILTKTAIRAGVWQGVLEISGTVEAPQIEVLHHGTSVDGVIIAPQANADGRFNVSVPIPTELLNDGVQSFLINDKATGEKLNAFCIVTGEPLEDDIRTEISLLRAELDMLKKAFRRHCLETS